MKYVFMGITNLRYLKLYYEKLLFRDNATQTHVFSIYVLSAQLTELFELTSKQQLAVPTTENKFNWWRFLIYFLRFVQYHAIFFLKSLQCE